MIVTSEDVSFYGFMYEKLGQANAIEIMKTVKWQGQQVYTAAEVKEANRQYLIKRKARKRQPA